MQLSRVLEMHLERIERYFKKYDIFPHFLTAISFAIAVLEVAPKLVILAALSFAEHSCVMLSTEQH